MDSGTAQPNGAADVYAVLFADATTTTDGFLSHDVTTEERPGGAGACSQSSSGHSNDAGGAGACSKSSSGCASARKRTKRTPKQYKVLKTFAGVPITTHTLETKMLSKGAPEADTYVNSLCLLAQATGATRKSDVGMKSAGDVGYILACKSSQCPVQFKVVITQGLSLQEGNELLWVADVEVQGLVTGMDGDFAAHHHAHTRMSKSKNILAKDTSLTSCHKAWLLRNILSAESASTYFTTGIPAVQQMRSANILGANKQPGRLLCRKKIHPLLETAPACGVP